MGSLGIPEILLCLVIGLIVFGPRKLPQIGKTIGKTLAEFKRATSSVMADIQQEIDTEEIQKTINKVKDIKDFSNLDINDKVKNMTDFSEFTSNNENKDS